MINIIQQSPEILFQTKPIQNVKAEIGEDMQSPAGNLKAEVENGAAAKNEAFPAKNRRQDKGAVVEFDMLAEKIKSFLELDDVDIQFSKDEDTNKMVLKLIDSSTQEVLRQIPEETVLQLAKFIAKKLDQGQLTDAKV